MRRLPAERLLLGLFLALLLWIPVPNGSFFADWAGAFQVGMLALLGLWAILWALGRVEPAAALTAARWPLGILAAWIVLQALHVVPLPPSVLQLVSPASAEMHGHATAFAPASDWRTISVDPYASKLSLLKTLAYAATFFLTLALANTRNRIRWVAIVLVGGALAHSVYAVLLHLFEVSGRFFGAYVAHGNAASGTFWNRNHFAGYLELTLALGIGLLIAGLSDQRAESWKQFARLTIEWVLSPKMVLRLALCILVIALTTTHSRMGNTAFFASLLIAGTLGIVLSRHATRNAVLLLSSLVIIDLLIVGSWFGVERLVQRMEETTTLEVIHRETPAAHTFGMVERFPVLGAGPGTFYASFEPFRPETVVDYYNFTHNDYAQLVAESGLLGLAVIGAFVLVILAGAIRAQWARRDPLMRGMSFACIMAVAAFLIHSTADFNLQIPSNAAYFMVLLAMGWISLHHGREGAEEAPAEGTQRSIARVLLVAPVLAVLAWVAIESSQAARAHGALASADAVLSFEGRSSPGTQELASLRRAVLEAEAHEPDNPLTQELLALLALRRAEGSLPGEAVTRLERSLAARPVSPLTWANLAAARYEAGETGEAFRTALRHAARLGPSHPQAQRLVAFYGLAVLEEVDPATRTAVVAIVAAGMRRAPNDFLAIAQRRGRIEEACRHLPPDRKVEPRWAVACGRAAPR